MSSPPEILSDDEKNAVLKETTSDQPAEAKDENPNAGLELVDFTAVQSKGMDAIPGLAAINELFSIDASLNVSKFLSKKTQIEALKPRLINFGDYVNNLAKLTSVNFITLNSLHSTAIINLSSKLLFNIISLLFGGKTSDEDYRQLEFGKVDERIAFRLVEIFMLSWKATWKEIAHFDYSIKQTMANARLINYIAPEETLLVNEYILDFNGVRSPFEICVCFSSIEPLKTMIKTGGQRVAEGAEQISWHKLLRENVYDTPLKLIASFPRVQIKLSDLLNLKVGNVITIENPNLVDIYVGGIKAYYANCGVANEQRVIEIRNKIKQ